MELKNAPPTPWPAGFRAFHLTILCAEPQILPKALRRIEQAFGERVRYILKKDKAKDDVFILCSVEVLAQNVGGIPVLLELVRGQRHVLLLWVITSLVWVPKVTVGSDFISGARNYTEK